MRRLLILLPLLLAILASCERDLLSNPFSPLDGLSTKNERQVYPGQTDDNLGQVVGIAKMQLGYVPENNGEAKNRLFVMIPGTLSEPKDYKLLLKTAAENGYHSIGIDYNNNQTLKALCQNSNDANCSANALNEYLTGENTSGEVQVSEAESFENRISKMLLYLHDEYPNDNWGQYLTTLNKVVWAKVSLAGHSQGGTHALYISKVRSLWRASFFSSPNGFEAGGVFPQWVEKKGLTSTNNLYAFSHRHDKLMNWNELNRTWDALNLVNKNLLIDVHKNLDDYHRFYTQTSNGFGLIGGTHGATCTDKDTPKDRHRNPRFKNVWIHMCYP